MKPLRLSLLSLLLPALSAASCPRPLLKSLTSLYVTSQTSGNPSALHNLSLSSLNFLYIENNKLLDIRSPSSTLSKPITIDFHRSIHDTEQCATLTEIIAANNPGHPYVIHTRMVFSPSSDTQAIPLFIESVVTDEGDWLFNATGTLQLNAPEKWDPIPLEKQEPRALIKSLGDAYFDRFGNVNVTVPWGAPCYRLEGGLPAKGELLANGECVMVWPSTIKVPYRRYVVDEEYGAVDIFMGFPGLDRTQGQEPMPDSHLFRVEQGKIKYCHTVSACVKDGCGLNGTTFPGME
ncbi:hypothetical protein QBC44DRAFT_272840 [Cladorrhinum sp. PSN332]|nr:hypothetical protein QBC44DRAFT_272840 [Cladorrhinum sp. PSN332]